MTAVRILIDVHERQSRFADVLVEELGAEVEIVPLPAGEYFVGADTLVERKRVLDLHGAVIKGRLGLSSAKLPVVAFVDARIARRFSTVAAVVAAGPEEWREVPGSAPTGRARRARRAVG